MDITEIGECSLRPLVFLSLWHLTFTAVYQHHNTPTPTLATSDGAAIWMMAKKRLSNALLYSKSIAKLERWKTKCVRKWGVFQVPTISLCGLFMRNYAWHFWLMLLTNPVSKFLVP